MSGPRFSDTKLQEFYDEFRAHSDQEKKERKQQQEMYDALFRQEDSAKNISPGVVQLLGQLAADVKVLRISADRQRTFIGGLVAGVAAVWFSVTELIPFLGTQLKKLF